ncbi:RDD family protein [Roseisalinus antarcticus]|uniref:RDD family protein n=1 Tax=Roseisalinus antarcticus TaxID=254357 RepID=A0A1Y5RJH0_9RHOB|nr:RDD family protein [Roseisalinus antarcticus]SLN19042.1 RDD family protein [Roseisalinus antarcticus]
MYADGHSAPRTAGRLPDPRSRPDFYEGVPGKRFGAWIADTVLVVLVCVLLLPFTAFLGLFFFPVMMLIVGFFYRWSTLAGGSATWGMRLMGIELREADGHRFSNGTALAHTLGYSVSIAVPVLQVISIVLMLITDRKQGLTDHIIGTAALNKPV